MGSYRLSVCNLMQPLYLWKARGGALFFADQILSEKPPAELPQKFAATAVTVLLQGEAIGRLNYKFKNIDYTLKVVL